jgi:ComF family protein
MDLVFPPRCPGCRELLAAKGPFCGRCLETFADLPPDRCRRCSEPEVHGLCAPCRENPPAFERAVTPYLYGGALADAIHRFKYEDCPHYATALAAVAHPHAEGDLDWCTAVAPVPLHVKRLRRRGYDQALLLSRALAAFSRRPVEARAVRRVRETPPQVGRDRDERRRNVAGAFGAGNPFPRGARILLVDDVLTTGATAGEAAGALLASGAASVRVFALARAV